MATAVGRPDPSDWMEALYRSICSDTGEVASGAGLTGVQVQIRKRCTLETLNLRHLRLGQNSAAFLQTRYASNATLTTLDIGYNYLNDKAIASMISLVATMPALRTLAVPCNRLSERSVHGLCDWIGRDPPLSTLAIGNDDDENMRHTTLSFDGMTRLGTNSPPR